MSGAIIMRAVMGRSRTQRFRELIEKHSETMAFPVAGAHAARGEADAAFAWLERAYAQRDGGLAETKVNPHFRSLHGDPRWRAFLKQMGLED